MGKYLDSIDYNKIVFNTFQLPESDFFKYYSNVVEDHLANNSDLFDELLSAIERRIEWYRKLHPIDYSIDETRIDKNGTKQTVTHILDNWDEADMILMPVYLQDGTFIRKVNKPFFDKQIEIVTRLKSLNEIDRILREAVKPKYKVHQFEKETKQDNKRTSDRKLKDIKTFNSLFRDSNNAQKVKDIFENKGYTLRGEWQGLTGEASELRDAFYVLKPLLKPGKDSPRAKVFYSEFGLTVATKKEGGYISERMLTIIPMNHKCKEFEDIFSDLLK